MTSTQEELLKKIEQTGECEVEGVDDANIPVNIFISEPDEDEPGGWSVRADNFCPRKASVYQSAYEFTAPDKETCAAVVKEFFLPIYKTAVQQLETNGELYYWQLKEKT